VVESKFNTPILPSPGSLGWARVRPEGAHFLRRGAWYPVVNDRAVSLIVLDIARRNVAVPRESVEIRRQRPERFSVVVRQPSDPSRRRAEANELGGTYAVCPVTRARVPFAGHPRELPCTVCGAVHPLDWESTC